MFVATVDIWPHGDWSRAERRTTIVAANDGTGTSDRGNYQAILIDGEHELAPSVMRLMLMEAMREGKAARVNGFPRGHDQHHLPALTAEIITALGCREFLAAA